MPRRIGIIRAHLEEDAGKSMHDEVAGKADSRIDLNRAGTPLLEIVSQPDLRSPAEAKAYLTELKLLLNYLGVSDCNMQEGSLRVDANINLHIDTPQGKIATPIVEVKNMNSFRAVERALAYEAERQWQRVAGDRAQVGRRAQVDPRLGRGLADHPRTTLEGGIERLSLFPRSRPGAGHGDRGGSGAGAGVAGRIARRTAHAARTNLRHHALRQRRAGEPGPGAGRLLHRAWPTPAATARRPAIGCSRTCCGGWTTSKSTSASIPVRPQALAELIGKVRGGAFETSRGREVLGVMVASGKSLAEAIAAVGIEEVDDSALIELCRKLVAANPKIVAEVKEGKLKGLGALIGQAKKENPNVNSEPRPGIVPATHQRSSTINAVVEDITKARKRRCVMRVAIWLSFDIGLRGDYEGMYAWLDEHGAVECGDSVAYMKYECEDDFPESLEQELRRAIEVTKKTRIYVVWREPPARSRGDSSLVCAGRRRGPVLEAARAGLSPMRVESCDTH